MGQRTRKLEAPHGIECVSLGADPRPRHRRARLEELVTGQQRIFPVRRLAPNDLDAWAEVEAEDLGGLEVHDKLESIRAFDRKLGRWGTVQHPPGK